MSLDNSYYQYGRAHSHDFLIQNKEEDIYGNVEEYLQPATGENELYAQIKACGIQNIPSNLIQ